jgi:hypothetical protein
MIPLGIGKDSRHLAQPLPSSFFMKATNDMVEVSGRADMALPA